MAWEQWTMPAMLLAGVGGLYYFMAKKGIGYCGSMMSPQPTAEARSPAGHAEVAHRPPPSRHAECRPSQAFGR